MIQIELDEFAEHAYEAYVESSRIGLSPMEWKDLPVQIRAAWRAAASRVVMLCGAALMSEDKAP